MNTADTLRRTRRIGDTRIGAAAPADKAGLKPNDIILKADKTNVSSTDGLKAYIETKLDQPVTLTIERAGQQQTIDVIASSARTANEGRLGIGIDAMKYNPTFGLNVRD